MVPVAEIRRSRNGLGVFAVRDILYGEIVVQFDGPLLPREKLPYPYTNDGDYYIQVGPNLYMGPSGGLDDYINHSCDPNCGLFFSSGKILLKAIRGIQANEEVCFDYSTTMDESGVADFGNWEMDCLCGTTQCRHRIKDFFLLPEITRERYIRLGIVPEFILRRPGVNNKEVASEEVRAGYPV